MTRLDCGRPTYLLCARARTHTESKFEIYKIVQFAVGSKNHWLK